MSSDWREARIGDLGHVITGRTPPGNDPAYYGGDVQFLTPSDFQGARRPSTNRTLSSYGAEKLRRCLITEGVGVSCIGWQMGKSVLIDRPTVTNQQINTIVVQRDVADTRFVYYSLLGRRSELFRMASGGSRTPILNKSEFESLPFRLPPLPVQKRIAHILGTLDDKIELNRRMNETLEAIARAIFKSWFVDFDPVIDNALRAGNPIPAEFAERADVRRRMLSRNQPSPLTPLPPGEGKKKAVNYRGGYRFSDLVERARELRAKATPAEQVFWELVRDRRFMGLKFRRQHQLGDYVADFYCHEQKLVVELDGPVHEKRVKKDAKRDAYMRSLGLTILRFSNDDLLDDPESVLEDIANRANSSPANASPTGRGHGEGAELEGRQPAGMDPETAALFPSEFVESELGPIPKGWEVTDIGSVATIASGKRPTERFQSPSGDAQVPLWGGNGPMAYVREPLVDDRILLTGRVGTLGSVFRISAPCWPSDNTLVVRANDDSAYEFLYFQLRRVDYASLNRGSTQPLLTQKDLKAQIILRPDERLLHVFHDVCSSLFLRIDVALSEVDSLAEIREALLPKLISGELGAPLEPQPGGADIEANVLSV